MDARAFLQQFKIAQDSDVNIVVCINRVTFTSPTAYMRLIQTPIDLPRWVIGSKAAPPLVERPLPRSS
jgi:hypothetical protein